MPPNIVYRTNDKLLHGSEVAYSTNSIYLNAADAREQNPSKRRL